MYAEGESHPSVQSFNIQADIIIQNYSYKRNTANQHHFCLALADVKNKKFKFLNPFGSSLLETNNYLSKFLIFASNYYNKNNKNHINTSNWTVEVMQHDKQDDTFNCGVYIIYFFQNVIMSIPLNKEVNINAYRRGLKKIIIESSDNMSDKCIYILRKLC